MAGETRAQYTPMGSPLTQPRYRHPVQGPQILKHLNVMLGSFQRGMGKTEEELKAMAALDNEQDLAVWLKRAGLLDRRVNKPTVAQMLEAGNNVLILGDDGKPVTYTEKFFQNETVLKLQQQEAETGKPMGTLMAAHMAMFFGERKGPGLENMETAFGGLNVVDARRQGKSPAYILNGGKSIVSVLEYSVSAMVDAAMKPVEDLERDLNAEEPPQPPEDIGKEPEVPDMPREKNAFRRFFCFFGFPHSRTYKDALAERTRKQRELETYREEKKPEYERQKREYEQKVEELRQKEEQLDKLREQAKKNRAVVWKDKVLENARTNAEKLLPFINAKNAQKQYEKRMAENEKFTSHEREMEKFQRDVPGLILNEGTVKELDDSALKTFQPGSLPIMLDILRRKGERHAELTVPRLQEELIRSVDPRASAYFLQETAKKYKGFSEAAGSIAEKDYLEQVGEDYKARVDTARMLFIKVFGKEPTVENVKAVAEVTGMEKHVEKLMESESKPYTSENKLPEIDESNVGDMTLLIMTGLKTTLVKNAPLQGKDKEQLEILAAIKREQEQVETAGQEQRLVVYQSGEPIL